MLSTLNASKRSCRFHPSFGSGKLLNSEVSTLKTGGPLNGLRPSFPNPNGTGVVTPLTVKDWPGIVKAHGLNQVASVWILSAARPPCEMVFWQAGSGLAATA